MPFARRKNLICHFTTVHAGFDARIWERECVSLAQAGFGVHLVAPDCGAEFYKGVRLHSLPQARNRVARFLSSKSAAGNVLQLQPELIHFHDPELIPAILSVKHRTGVKVIFDCHEDTLSHILLKEHIPAWLKSPLRKIIEYYFHRAAREFDAIITADHSTSELFRNWGARPVTLFNFPPAEIYGKEPDWHFNHRPYDVIYPGSAPRYHLETMFGIAAELKRRGRKTRWLILSDLKFEGAQNWVQKNLAQYDLMDAFEFLPQVPLSELPKFLHKARVGIIPLPDTPKFHRNIPSKLFDYFLAGLPVVLSDLPPSRRFLDNPDIALSVKPGDISAYADALERLLRNETRMREMGKTARQTALAKFTWQTEASKLIDLYRGILAEGSSAKKQVRMEAEVS